MSVVKWALWAPGVSLVYPIVDPSGHGNDAAVIFGEAFVGYPFQPSNKGDEFQAYCKWKIMETEGFEIPFHVNRDPTVTEATQCRRVPVR